MKNNSRALGLNIKSLVLANPSLFSRLDQNTQNLLRSEQDATGKQIKQILRAVEKEVAYHFASANATGFGAGSKTPLYNNAQAKQVGISDFEQNMAISQDCIIGGLKFMYAASADAVTGNKKYTNLLYSRQVLQSGITDIDAGAAGNQGSPVPALSIPSDFMNAILVLSVGGKEKVRRPIYQFFIENDRKDYMSGENADFISLEHEPIFVSKGEAVTCELLSPEGVAIAAASAGYHLLRWSIKVSSFETIG